MAPSKVRLDLKPWKPWKFCLCYWKEVLYAIMNGVKTVI